MPLPQLYPSNFRKESQFVRNETGFQGRRETRIPEPRCHSRRADRWRARFRNGRYVLSPQTLSEQFASDGADRELRPRWSSPSLPAEGDQGSPQPARTASCQESHRLEGPIPREPGEDEDRPSRRRRRGSEEPQRSLQEEEPVVPREKDVRPGQVPDRLGSGDREGNPGAGSRKSDRESTR